MTNLIDIPIVVTTLITFFTSGGSEAVLEVFKGITVNTALMLSDLKDELLGKSEVNTLVEKVVRILMIVNTNYYHREHIPSPRIGFWLFLP